MPFDFPFDNCITFTRVNTYNAYLTCHSVILSLNIKDVAHAVASAFCIICIRCVKEIHTLGCRGALGAVKKTPFCVRGYDLLVCRRGPS